MPEYGESWISQLLIYLWMLWMLSVGGSLDVLNIWLDATDTEQKAFPAGSRARQGHVYPIDDTSTVIRGQRNNQKHVYPPAYAKSGVPIVSRGLKLQDVVFAARNVILNLGPQWVQIQLFTHTNAQVYTRADWDEAVCKVNKKDRKFRVGFALEFEKYVVAFVTMDNLIATHWATTREDLPASCIDVFDDFCTFLETAVAWMSHSRRSTKRRQTAMNAVRTAVVPTSKNQKVYPGLGVYTVDEVWRIASLPPDVSEKELFDDPSATARFHAAYYEVASEARENLWDFVRPCVHNWVIAASIEQRLKYPDRLWVFGKSRTEMTEREANLYDEFEADRKYHPFEPTLIRRALQRETTNLGHLIFGRSKWLELAADAGIVVGNDMGTDPLSQYYSTCGTSIVECSTLNINAYSTLFVSNLRARWRPTHLYRSTAGKSNVWSVISSAGTCTDLTPKSEKEKTALLLKNVISNSGIWTVGPLDYCGVAKVIPAQGTGKPIIAVCENDPRLTPFYATKRALSLAKITNGLNTGPGVSRPTIGKSLSKAKRRGLPSPSNKMKENKRPTDEQTQQQVSIKRRRVSADGHMVVCVSVVGDCGRRKTRRDFTTTETSKKV